MGPKDPSELSERVRFERRASGSDDYGNVEGDWATLIDSRAVSLRPTRGGEQVIGQRLQGTAAFDLWVRFDSQTNAVREGDRVVDARDSRRVFNVRFVQDMDGLRTWLLMQLELGVADG